MRIVGGRHRGRRLLALPGNTVRPTSDRAREALTGPRDVRFESLARTFDRLFEW